uniref:DUF4371 domain-containing protein n=1 Tax=Octopus bimaculoides TaxID=37653 RepID=A0A0L8HGA9_OCTBM
MAFKERFRIDLRNILPYVHCLNHQLHLVVVNTIKWIPELATLSDTVNILHNFIKRPKISNLCKRLKLPRLMGQRWWGSFQYRCFCNRKSLQHCWFAKTCIEAILHQVRSKRFVFLALVLSEFLHTIRPVDSFSPGYSTSFVSLCALDFRKTYSGVRQHYESSFVHLCIIQSKHGALTPVSLFFLLFSTPPHTPAIKIATHFPPVAIGWLRA